MAMADQRLYSDARFQHWQAPMLIQSLPHVTQFVTGLNQTLTTYKPSASLSGCQQRWLCAVLMGIVVTGTLNWAAFERRSLRAFKESRLRWMFSQAKLAWPLLLQASIAGVLRHYGVSEGVLVIDDTDKQRAKRTTKIAGAHTIKDKKTGGYFNGQVLVVMVLVTDRVTLPVGFRWYRPDPVLRAWRKANRRLKRQGVPRDQRPARPAPNPAYPTKQALALALVDTFTQQFPDLVIKATLADALYGTGDFMDQVQAVTGAQVISQLRSNQQVYSRGRKVSLTAYFNRQSGVATELVMRGGDTRAVTVLAARLHVKAHGQRRFIIALKYDGETAYRFLVASDLSWRHQDITRLYTLRWLVEVFIMDWKQRAGWHRLAKQQGEEGSTRGVILSLLCDHLLLLHPQQSARLSQRQPGLSAGCLIESLKAEALIVAVEAVVTADEPAVALTDFSDALRDTLPERASSKHMAGRDLGRLEATPSLRYRAAELEQTDRQSQR